MTFLYINEAGLARMLLNNMKPELLYDFLEPGEFNSFCEFVFEFGESRYALEIGATEAHDRNSSSPTYGGNIKAYNITCTIPVGYNNLIKDYPDFGIFMDKIIDPECNFLHFVSLKMATSASIEMHLDDGVDDHLNVPTGGEWGWTTPIEVDTPESTESRKDDKHGHNDDHSRDSFTLRPLPKWGDCFYMKIPEVLEGGQYYWNPKNTGTPAADDVYVTPVDNLRVHFPGTMWHGVTQITKSSGDRCMFVVEQYALSKRSLRKLSNYDTPVIRSG